MKILLLSDTHSYIDERILHHVQNADEVWHAGDIGDLAVTDKIRELKPLRAVYGNIDGTEARKDFPLNQLFTCEKVKVLMTHIGGYPGRYAKGIKDLLLKERPQIFISGHSHILKVQYDNQLNILHLNPGAAGIYGHHQARTMLRFEIISSDIKNMEIIELKK